jgi:hypothetical protein
MTLIWIFLVFKVGILSSRLIISITCTCMSRDDKIDIISCIISSAGTGGASRPRRRGGVSQSADGMWWDEPASCEDD